MADAAPHTDSLESIVTFEDVFIHFTREEWDLLTESQKRLYHKTMVNNFALVMSVGLESSRYRLTVPPQPESAPEVPARIGIAAAVEEVSQESPGPSPGHSVEDRDDSSVSIKISDVRSLQVAPSIENSPVCDSCNPVFSGVFQLAGQPETSSEQQLFMCGSCGRAFPLSVSFDQMQRWQSGGTVTRRERDQAASVNSHGCLGLGTACTREEGEDISASSGVVQHPGTQNGESPCTSAECGHVQQQEIDVQERSYECNTCRRVFNCRDTFNNHQEVHTGERSSECDVCGKSFTRSYYMKIHKRLHTGIRPFVCDECGKTYIAKSHLTLHKKTHTIESLRRQLVVGNVFLQPVLVNAREVTQEQGLGHSANEGEPKEASPTCDQ